MIRKEGHIDPRGDERKIRREVEKELTRIGLDAERTMLEYLTKHNIDDNGDLAQSITSEVKQELGLMRLRFGANAKHAIYVHDGTKPHYAPITPLEKWVVRKLRLVQPEAKRVAYAIQKKIAKVGTKAKPFAAVTHRLLRRTAQLRIDGAIARGVARAS